MDTHTQTHRHPKGLGRFEPEEGYTCINEHLIDLFVCVFILSAIATMTPTLRRLIRLMIVREGCEVTPPYGSKDHISPSPHFVLLVPRANDFPRVGLTRTRTHNEGSIEQTVLQTQACQHRNTIVSSAGRHMHTHTHMQITQI